MGELLSTPKLMTYIVLVDVSMAGVEAMPIVLALFLHLPLTREEAVTGAPRLRCVSIAPLDASSAYTVLFSVAT